MLFIFTTLLFWFFFFFFLMIRRPPRSTLFPSRRSSDLDDGCALAEEARLIGTKAQQAGVLWLRARQRSATTPCHPRPSVVNHVTMAARSPKKRDYTVLHATSGRYACDDGCALAEEARLARRRRRSAKKESGDGCTLAEEARHVHTAHTVGMDLDGDDGCVLAEEARRRVHTRLGRPGRRVMMAVRSPKKRDTLFYRRSTSGAET